MKKIKLIITNLLYIIFCITATAANWGMWGLAELTNHLIINIIAFFVMLLFLILGVLSVSFIKYNIKEHRILSFTPLLILLVTISFFTFLPLTKVYIYSHYKINEKSMDSVIEVLEHGDLRQTNSYRYAVPIKYRLTTQTGRILVEEKDESKKVLFYVHCGAWKSSAVIYVSNDSEIIDGDFGRVFDKIFKLKDNWYGVIMEWQ